LISLLGKREQTLFIGRSIGIYM